MTDLKENYREKFNATSVKLNAAKRKVSFYSYSRFFLFVGFGFCCWMLYRSLHYWWTAPGLVSISAFFYLVKLQAEQEKQVRFFQTLLRLIEAELNALQGNFSAFDPGKEFIDFDHAYSFDLDVFGEGSLYQQMNRTSSNMGRKKLAEWLQEALTDKTAILQKQETFKELAAKKTFRLHFLAKGLLHPFTDHDNKMLSGWMKSEEQIKFGLPAKILLLVLPVVTIGSLIAWISGYVSYSLPALFATINFTWVVTQLKKVNAIHRQLGSKFKLVQNLSAQLNLFEKEEVQSEMLVKLKNGLASEKTTASKAIGQLGSIMQSFDARLNIFGAFVFNSLFLFDLQMARRLVDWKKRFGQPASSWLEVMSELEAYNSLGTYVYNHPGFVFPEVVENMNTVEVTEMGHPLMPAEKRVNNSFELSGKGKFVIVTGSNMSGKSTFLRTIGLNLVLAQCGAPVCSKTFRFSPAAIFTSMRINDSLQQNESYFYAEIKRLNKITCEAATQKPMLILLDEILRGTNSTDKHTGSEALMLKLTELNATGILATHDLSLGKLENMFPGRFTNKCFESVIENNELFFDYRMRDGVCKNLNAVFLMKKMGIM